MNYRRQKPRWVLVRENEEARRAAHAQSLKNPFDVINARVRASDEYRAAMVAIEAEVKTFWLSLPADQEQVVAILRERGGRTAILREIIARLGSAQIHQSELFGYAPLSRWIALDDVRAFESTAVRQRVEARS